MHLQNIDQLSGEEYMAGNEELFDSSFFIDFAQETSFEKLYSQLEFKEFGKCLCTVYGPMTTFSIIMGREWTKEERLELVKRRTAQGDFDPLVGGFTSIGVDVVRRYHNELYPDNPIRTAMVNDKKLLEKLAQKNIPITTSVRLTRGFIVDYSDGTLDKKDTWKGKVLAGHCRTRRKLEVIDNYLKKYVYTNIDDLNFALDSAIESKNVFIAFRESNLSDLGKKYLAGMKAKVWNGERANDLITRYEASVIAQRLNPLVSESKIWNKKDGNKPASIFEVSTMFSKTSKVVPYLGIDRNKTLTRGEAIQLIY